ncbi:Protein of unknown function [Polaromonas sp. OV174]|uniref:DUF2917 domain-containing protein n=1 Tax=Polaromonas sp. OV174 TaxID=1855300 RepID=UPI0008E43B73|nr:DUF2917 domain-containing protein [Polaromonas sp. OV174]SFB90654.1 Protein of unknown function [Polaromonas sp. OV174]
MDHLTTPRFAHQMEAVSRSAAAVGAKAALAGQAGNWQLAAGRAMALQAGQAGVLRIAHGRVWATFDHADQRRSTRAGDHFLSRGDSLCLQPGEGLVMESYGIGHTPSALFSWEPALAGRGETAARSGAVGVLGLAGRAVTRVATAFAIGFVAARARCTSAERQFKAQTCE